MNGLNAQHIYAYEGDEANYSQLCKYLEYLPTEFKNKVYAIKEYIGLNTKFSEIKDRNENISLITADIEGAEYELLKSIQDIIICDRPVLALCVYHRADDLVTIPSFLNEILCNYTFMLRKYETNLDDYMRTAELVLYAIPDERTI